MLSASDESESPKPHPPAPLLHLVLPHPAVLRTATRPGTITTSTPIRHAGSVRPAWLVEVGIMFGKLSTVDDDNFRAATEALRAARQARVRQLSAEGLSARE